MSGTSPSVQVSYPAGIAHAHGELLTHHELQFDFPQSKPAPPPPQWSGGSGASFVVGPLLQVLGWTLFAALIGLIVYFVVRTAMQNGWFRGKRKKEEKTAPAEPEWRPAPAAARNLLRDADALAAKGKYGEAVHLILLRSIEHIDTQRPDLVRQALTSREIAQLQQLPPGARTTFSGIAQVVEQALFAEREISAEEFARCRDAYERFAFPDTWRLAA
ncbi:MAG TPA: DUF4129 domain-containing protein [Rhizomicrobium sp.]|nr:DUF4129 domain-containing protein [Rhizomicrobium sp.]